MNPEVLCAITESVDEAILRFGCNFAGIISHQTSGQQVRQSNADLAEHILDRLEEFLNPEILVVPKREIDALPLEKGAAFGDLAMQDAIRCLSCYGRFMPRAEAEVTSDYVQIVPCGLLRYQDKVFLFQRKESDPKYRLYGRTTIWQGCHVSKREGVEFAALLKTTILERVSRSLFLSRVFPIDALGYCWDRQDPNSSRHFGVIYQIRIDDPHTVIDLKKKEFKRQRGHGLIGQFDAWQQLVASQDDLTLESWSRSIIDHLSEAT